MRDERQGEWGFAAIHGLRAHWRSEDFLALRAALESGDPYLISCARFPLAQARPIRATPRPPDPDDRWLEPAAD